MYRKCTTYTQQAECVADVVAACTRVYQRRPYSDPDARAVGLVNLIATAQSAAMMLNLFEQWTNGDQFGKRAIPSLLGITPVTAQTVNAAAGCLKDTSKVAFVVTAQFQIENLFANIARTLNVPHGTGFYITARALLDHLGLPTDRLATLMTAAHLRNSYHSNGIHRAYKGLNTSTTVTVSGVAVTYDFRDDEPVRCASWEHLSHALEGSVGVVEEVLAHRLVSAIPDPMMDRYAWEEETRPG